MTRCLLLVAAAAALVLSATGAPALADQAADDLAALRGCLDRQGDDGEPGDCIGTVSDPCMELPEGQTTVGMDECLGREMAAWDVLLNEGYKAQMAYAREQDEQFAQSGLEPGATDSLRAAQRAWIAYRDAECDRLYEASKDGTIRTNIASGCMLDLTAARAIDFMTVGLN